MAKNYRPEKTLEKVLISLIEILLAGTVVYLTDNSLFLFLVPAIEGIRNLIKHKWLT